MNSLPTVTDVELEAVTRKLLASCRALDWAGDEPYDALNSPLLAALPFLDSRLPRLVLTQALKRSPINIRRLLLIPKKQNAKPVAVFLSAFLKLSGTSFPLGDDDVQRMLELLVSLRSPGSKYWCWGYSFPWQTRTELVPSSAPNLVCTCFVAGALLDAFEQRQDSELLSMAVSAAEYVLNELYWTSGRAVAGFAYPTPSVRNQVHNANFLAAALLCRVYRLTGDKKFLSPALKVAWHSAGKQAPDGSWAYGEASTQTWIDNFHTGYNLCALRDVGKYAEVSDFEPCIRRGFRFYRDHFFRSDGAVRYFHDKPWPVDAHCVAQTILTLLTLGDLDPDHAARARQVLRWTIDHMWDERGFFYYQVDRFWTNRISYVRWSQSWMFLALSTLLAGSEAANRRSAHDAPAAAAPAASQVST